MDLLNERSETGTDTLTPVERQLPSGKGIVERMALQSRGLVEDLTEWVELRLKLVQMDVEDRIDARVNRLVVLAAVALVGYLALLFMLVTIALALGAWLGHPAWGFLIVTVVLAVITGVLMILKPRFVNLTGRKPRTSASEKVKS